MFIPMDKLIKLLNEYENMPWLWSYEDWRIIIMSEDREAYQYQETYIISKKFWFIQWLVENDKINTDEFSIIEGFDDYECLLMRLAIDDNPIEFLVSILK